MTMFTSCRSPPPLQARHLWCRAFEQRDPRSHQVSAILTDLFNLSRRGLPKRPELEWGFQTRGRAVPSKGPQRLHQDQNIINGECKYPTDVIRQRKGKSHISGKLNHTLNIHFIIQGSQTNQPAYDLYSSSQISIHLHSPTGNRIKYSPRNDHCPKRGYDVLYIHTHFHIR